VSWLEGLAILGPGLIGVTLARHPDGIALGVADLWAGHSHAIEEVGEMPERVEELGLTIDFEPPHLAAIERELAIDA
jgi:hypothetical protein